MFIKRRTKELVVVLTSTAWTCLTVIAAKVLPIIANNGTEFRTGKETGSNELCSGLVGAAGDFSRSN